MEITDKEKRRRLKAYWIEYRRVETLRKHLTLSGARVRADYFVENGTWLPLSVLPMWPEFPPECVDMVCGGMGRRSGQPCQTKELFPNGRCKWHGGASTGPKTAEGKAKSVHNLRAPKL